MKYWVVLFPATMEDVDFIIDIKTDASFWPYEDDIKNANKEVVRKNVIERINSNWYKQYIVQLNTPVKTRVGAIHIHWYEKEREAWEIGYCIFPEYQRQGYCVEAAKLALKYAFEDENAHKVVAMCNECNIASYKVMEKIGMTREGIFREELRWQGKWVNQLFYCILDSEYQKMNVCS